MSNTNIFDAEAQKLIEIIDHLEQQLRDEFDVLTEAERAVRMKIIQDLKQAWTDAVLNWNRHHHPPCR